MAIDTRTGEQAQSGNYLSRKVLHGGDLEKLKAHYRIDQEPVSWDVGVPLLENRPVIDRNQIDPTQIRKSRGTLTVAAGDEIGGVKIRIGDLYRSTYDKTPITIGPPQVGDESQGLCAPGTESGLFGAFDFMLQGDGTITFCGVTPGASSELVELYSGNSPQDPTYAHLINFAERMITIPTGEGLRTPIEPATT